MAQNDKHEVIEPEAERETPDAQADFEVLLKDYGIKEKRAGPIAKYIADTGSANVFENPEELLRKLAAFPRDIAPVTRRTVLEHWTAMRNIPTSPELFEQAETSAEDLRLTKKQKEEESQKREEASQKYTVDDEGNINVATKDQRPALDWDEAEMLSKRRQKAVEERRKKEKGSDDKPSPFITTSDGEWTINPDAKLGLMEIMAWEGYQRGKGKGEDTDPLEYLARTGERLAALREALGIKGAGSGEGEGGLVHTLNTLNALGLLRPDDSGLKENLATMRQAIETLREERRKAELEAIEERHKAEMVKRDAQLQRATETIERVSGAIKSLQDQMERGQRAKSEYDILSDIISAAKGEIAGFRGDIRALLGSRKQLPPPRETAEAMTAEIKNMNEMDALAEELWFKEGE